jgi:hypothetical protein
MVEPGTGRQQEERQELIRNRKEKDYEKIEETGGFSAIGG